ncbi:MAG: 7TM diverse intracellular signaling domain-containing protein, partial [Chitinispirillia bacterium]
MSRKNPESSSTRQFLVVSLVSLLVISCLPTKTHTKTHAHAVDPVILNDREDEYPLGLHLEILNDPARQFSIEEVASPEFDGKFIRNKTKEINPGLVNSAYWIRFQVNSQAPQTGEWWLEVAGYEIDASLYYPRPDGSPGFEVKHAGKTRPAAGANRTLHYYPAFPLPLAPGSEQTIYLRVDGKRLNFSMTLWSGTGFIRESQKDFVILGLYWGVLLIMAGYNFFLFLALRDRSYLYYVLFLIFALSALVLRKVQIHLDLYAFLNPIATLMIVFLLRFSVTFLMAKVNAPRLGRILNGLQIGLVATGLLQIVLSGAILFHWIWFALVLSGFVAIFITSLVTWRRGYRPARYFVLAQTMLLVTFFFDLLGQLGYAPSISEYTSPAGVSLMAVLMSLALADRINIFRREHEKAELETRQRNRELVLLNQVITATTTELEFETVSRELGRAFSLTHAILVLADEKNSAIKIAADYHTGDGPSILGQSVPVKGDPLLEHISINKEHLIVEDAQNDTRTTSIREHFHLQNTTNLLLFPLVAENEIIGGFILGSDKPGRFSADELRLMQSVAEQMVGAIIRIRLAEERKQLEEQYHQSQKMEAIGCLAG